MQKLLALALFVGVLAIASAHVRLLDPPSRASMWRFEEFKQYGPVTDTQDNECFCGGYAVQYQQNGGRCGICGDNWADPQPRRHEGGGLYGINVIGRTYTEGQKVPVKVHLTADHKGWFAFKVCPQNNGLTPSNQTCLDKYPLNVVGTNSEKFYPTKGSIEYNYEVQLPKGLVCEHQCTVQFHYNTGNSWGDCGDGTGAIGCGEQENFRHCADIRILPAN